MSSLGEIITEACEMSTQTEIDAETCEMVTKTEIDTETFEKSTQIEKGEFADDQDIQALNDNLTQAIRDLVNSEDLKEDDAPIKSETNEVLNPEEIEGEKPENTI